jgi:hypothetical protein
VLILLSLINNNIYEEICNKKIRYLMKDFHSLISKLFNALKSRLLIGCVMELKSNININAEDEWV